MLSKNKRFRKTHPENPSKGGAMPDSSERKPSLKLSLFVGLTESVASEPNNARSPRCFDGGAVGLRIVAAMSNDVADVSPARAAAPALSRSDPIPIVPGRPATNPRGPAARAEEEEEDMEGVELSECYTCVISHVRGNPVMMRVYFDDGSDGMDGNYGMSSGVFFGSPLSPPATEFLSRCFLCQKELHGLDVFTYRGERAFCSVEYCRCQQIRSDEHGGTYICRCFAQASWDGGVVETHSHVRTIIVETKAIEKSRGPRNSLLATQTRREVFVKNGIWSPCRRARIKFWMS